MDATEREGVGQTHVNECGQIQPSDAADGQKNGLLCLMHHTHQVALLGQAVLLPFRVVDQVGQRIGLEIECIIMRIKYTHITTGRTT